MINYQPLPDGFQVDAMLDGGAHCPTCKQQTYLRPIDLSSVLVYALRVVADRSAQGAVTTGDDMSRHGRTAYCNYSQLKYWGLIVEDRVAGGWRITGEGLAFLADEISLPKRIYVFADEVRRIPDGYDDYAPSIRVGDVKPWNPKSRQEARERLVALGIDDV